MVAKRLAVSPFTVKNHLKAVFRKCGVANRTELGVRLAREHPGRTRSG